MNKQDNLTQNKPSLYNAMLLLALPILAAHIVEALIPFINTSLAGKQGALSLAATGLAGASFVALIGFGWGVIVSVGIITSHQLGYTVNETETGVILKASFLTALLVSIPIMGCMKLMYPIWISLGQAPEVASLAQDYLDGLSWTVFADLSKFAIFQFAIAHHKPRVPLIANLISIPFVYMLNQTLISNFGLYGLGLGTAIIYWLILIALFIYMRYGRLFRDFLTPSVPWHRYYELCMQQFRLGVPMGAMASIELLFFSAIGILMGKLSTEHLAAHQIAMQWLWPTVMAAVGFSEAVTILVARARAYQNYATGLKFLHIGILLATIPMLAVAALYWFAPHAIIALDLTDDPAHHNVIEIAVTLLALCGFYQILDGIRIVISGGLRGLADTQYPMWIAFIAFWLIGLPVAYICAFILNWKSTGLWLGMIFVEFIMIGLQYRRLRKQLTSYSSVVYNTESP